MKKIKRFSSLVICALIIVQMFFTTMPSVAFASDDGITENLVPYQTVGTAHIHSGDYNDRFTMMGIDYLNGVSFARDHSWIADGAEMLFNLDKAYEAVSFYIGNIDGSGTDPLVLQIYRDGVYFSEIELTYNMPTYFYTLNVSGTSQLKFVTREGKNYYSFGIANITGYTTEGAASANLTVPQKTSHSIVLNSNLEDGLDMVPYQTGGTTVIHNGDYNERFTMMGIDYLNGVSFARDHSWIKDGAEMLFNLGGAFEIVEFVIGNVDGSGTDPIVLQIYKDDVYFTEIELTYNMQTYYYSLNVSGANQLKFVTKEGQYYYSFGIADICGYTAEEVEDYGVSVPKTVTSEVIYYTNYEEDSDILPYQTNGSIGIYSGDVNNTFSIMGVKYTDGVAFSRDHSWISDNGEVLFNFGGMYQSMTFIVGHIDNAGEDAITLQIYKNGEYSEEISLTSNMIAKEYTVDLNGVNQLKIVTKDPAYKYGYGITDITVVDNGYDVPNRFTDVKAGAWYYEGVMYTSLLGYMNGTNSAKTLFSPNMQFTREQFIQLLFNMEGLDEADYSGNTGFSDVPAGKWYSAAVKWAKEAGVTEGIGDGNFGLGGKVSREQLAKFLMNYADMYECDTSARADISGYEDASTVSSWAVDAVKWAVAEELIGSTATEKLVLAPKRTAIRSEIAKITMSYDAYLIEEILGNIEIN